MRKGNSDGVICSGERGALAAHKAHAAGPAEELHKLNELKEKGALSQAEFDQAKAKLLG